MHKYLLLLFFFIASISQAKLSPNDLQKAQLTLRSYNEKGELIRCSNAFFINERGEAAASYAALIGAAKADIVDSKGKVFPVLRITGASATTDMVRFTTAASGKIKYLPVCETAATGTTALNVLRADEKKPNYLPVHITDDQAYAGYRYYDIDLPNDTAYFAAPVVDENGTIYMIVQPNVSKDANSSYAIDARFLNDLTITSTSALDNDLQTLAIPKALPEDKKDALAYIYMLSTIASPSLQTAYNDFIEAYPAEAEGYMNRADYLASVNQYAAAEADFTSALSIASEGGIGLSTHAVRYQISDIIYRTIVAQADTLPPYSAWTLQRADEEICHALSDEPLALYYIQKGKCRSALHDYRGAYESYLEASHDSLFATPETFYSAAVALEQAGGDTLGVIALLDSCISRIPRPATADAAPYYLNRATSLLSVGEYRKAVADFNVYEQLIGPNNLNPIFYYIRHKAELEARMYQQALDDIRTAAATSDDPHPYRIEEAYLLLRIGEYKMAIEAAETLLKDIPENADAHKIAGISYGELGDKEKALTYLRKALQLGDETVSPLIEKY